MVVVGFEMVAHGSLAPWLVVLQRTIRALCEMVVDVVVAAVAGAGDVAGVASESVVGTTFVVAVAVAVVVEVAVVVDAAVAFEVAAPMHCSRVNRVI